MRATEDEKVGTMKDMRRPRVLVIEDDIDLQTELVDFLRFYGTDAAGEGTVAGMLRRMQEEHWDVVVLDLGLPDGDGIAAARRLREMRKLKLGIVMVTARGHVDDRIAGLHAGTDAYLVKPVNPRELKAVIDQLMTRLGDAVAAPTMPTNPGWRLDDETLQLTAPDGTVIPLTGAEALVLKRLMQAQGKVVTRAELSKELPPGGDPDETRRLDSLISRLRSKVAQATGLELPVKTFRNLGYSVTILGKTGGFKP
jgi:DNA-binding response OmpR family regulator